MLLPHRGSEFFHLLTTFINLVTSVQSPISTAVLLPFIPSGCLIFGASSLLGTVQKNYKSLSNRSIQLFANAEICSLNLAAD